MGQAKERGTFLERKAEAIARQKTGVKSRLITRPRRRGSAVAAMLAILGSTFGGRNGR